MFAAISDYGITRQAIKNGLLKLHIWDPRNYTGGRRRAVDDRPYGGGPGMLMKPEPLARCIDAARACKPGPVVYLSPRGDLLDQRIVEELSGCDGLTLLSGRYEGVDERVIETRVHREISIGDYVIAGGELAAMVVIETVARVLPGVLGNDLSMKQDSFFNGLLDCPHYTRPERFEGLDVPPVLLSGNHEKIRQWRFKQSVAKTGECRPDLLERLNLHDNAADIERLDPEQMNLLKNFKLERKDD